VSEDLSTTEESTTLSDVLRLVESSEEESDSTERRSLRRPDADV
jgi:hypothetical protein